MWGNVCLNLISAFDFDDRRLSKITVKTLVEFRGNFEIKNAWRGEFKISGAKAGAIRPIQWPLLLWFHASPGHQQPCYWLGRMKGSLSSIMKKGFDYYAEKSENIYTWSETYFRQGLFPSYLFSRRQFHAIVIFRLKSISDLDSGSLPRFFGEFIYMKFKTVVS